MNSLENPDLDAPYKLPRADVSISEELLREHAELKPEAFSERQLQEFGTFNGALAGHISLRANNLPWPDCSGPIRIVAALTHTTLVRSYRNPLAFPLVEVKTAFDVFEAYDGTQQESLLKHGEARIQLHNPTLFKTVLPVAFQCLERTWHDASNVMPSIILTHEMLDLQACLGQSARPAPSPSWMPSLRF